MWVIHMIFDPTFFSKIKGSDHLSTYPRPLLLRLLKSTNKYIYARSPKSYAHYLKEFIL